MTKKVRLTWMNDDQQPVTEICLLVEESDRFALIDPEDGRVEPASEEMGIFDKLANLGVVLFEDEEGLFGLMPNDIVHIEEMT